MTGGTLKRVNIYVNRGDGGGGVSIYFQRIFNPITSDLGTSKLKIELIKLTTQLCYNDSKVRNNLKPLRPHTGRFKIVNNLVLNQV